MIKWIWKELIMMSALIVFLLLCVDYAYSSQDVVVSWEPSTGSDVAGYTVHYGASQGNYTNTVDVDAGTLSHTLIQTAETNCFVVTAKNSSGAVGAFSNEQCVDDVFGKVNISISITLNPN